MIAPVLFSVLLAAAQDPAPLPDHPPAKYLNAEEASRTSGRRVTVCGDVTSVEYTANATAPTLFDLDAPATAPLLAVAMRPSDLKRFPQMFDHLLIGRRLCVAGSVALVEGRAELPLRETSQVLFIGQPVDAPDFGLHANAVSAHAPGMSPMSVVASPAPKYTPEAMRARIEGTVAVLAIVGTDGKVKDVRLKTSLDPIYGLDTEALRTAANWRFTPARRDGVPVNTIATIMLTFNLH